MLYATNHPSFNYLANFQLVTGFCSLINIITCHIVLNIKAIITVDFRQEMNWYRLDRLDQSTAGRKPYHVASKGLIYQFTFLSAVVVRLSTFFVALFHFF